MSGISDVFGLDRMTFHEKDGARHEFRPTVEYVYNALPYFFPSNEGGATAIRQVGANATSSGKAYSVNGMVSDGQGIVIQNGKKYINPKR